jgi:hypothetical protein
MASMDDQFWGDIVFGSFAGVGTALLHPSPVSNTLNHVIMVASIATTMLAMIAVDIQPPQSK